jgi:hypothetical protein
VHSLSGDGIGRDKSGHGKNPTEQGALTNWRQHREGQVRTWKESDRARRTHELETTSGGTSQDMERIRPSEAHSHPGDGIGRDKSGHRKNPTKRGSLTLWRRHREGQVRTRKESDRVRHTHVLEMASGGTSQDTETIQLSEAHSRPGGGTSQDTERIRPTKAHSHPGDSIGRDKSGHGKNPTNRGTLTNWRQHREGQVRTRKESD